MSLEAKTGRRQQRLTALFCKKISKTGRFADGNTLFLYVRKQGIEQMITKSWIVRTVVRGKRRDIGLGPFPLVSLSAAREEAARLRGIARSGGDPLEERRREERVIPTFEEVANKVHASLVPSFKNEKHASQWISSLRTFAFPFFGSHRVDSIGTPEILKSLQPIWLERPETARRVRQRLRTVFGWAKACDLRSGDNPVDGVIRVLPKQPTEKRHHASLPFRQVSEFVRALKESGAGRSAKLAFEFMILTVTRTSEVIQASWSEVDLESRMWTIPARRMKSGREHRVPLSDRCLEILTEAWDLADGGSYVFPGKNPERHLSNMCFHSALKSMKQTVPHYSFPHLSPHGFRASFRSWQLEATNISNDVAESVLAHSVRENTVAAYNRNDLFDRRIEAHDRWSTFLRQEPGKIIQMPR